jgi:predicted KAP-like P-loop ATPase
MNALLRPLSSWRARRRAKLTAANGRSEVVDDGIGAEAPIRVAAQDRLRRAEFAGRVAAVLSELSIREGRVFAIRGGWGFGKSSLKNLVTEQLDARADGADWLDFNPWQWGDANTIARALFDQIADRLGGAHSSGAVSRAAALRRYGAILTGVGDPLKKAGDSSGIISTVLTSASVVAVASAVGLALPSAAKVAIALAVLAVGVPLIGRLLAHLGRDRTAEPIDTIRAALEKQLRELERPLVVFVDDIDRLEPEQIRMLLRQVKANANLPNIVFVLLFQPSIVEKALDPVADGDGRAFLEKIVQANFDLPAVPVTAVHREFAEELSRLASTLATEANGFSQTRWGNALIGCIQPFIRNMRDSRRLLSSIAVHMPLHTEGATFEVNIVDFLVLETIRVFEPDLHGELFRQRDLVLQTGRYSRNADREADKTAASKLLEVVPTDRRSTAREAIKELFPQLEWAYGGTNYGDGWLDRWLKAKRVCSARFFPRYFELQTAEGELSERGFEDFLAAAVDEERLRAAVSQIEAAGLTRSLVARLDESVDRLPVEHAATILPVMFRIGQSLSGTRALDPFNSPWLSAWRAINWYLKRAPEQLRGALVQEAFRGTEALSVAATLIHLSDPADRKEGDEPADPTLDLDTVQALKMAWLDIIRRRAADTDGLAAELDLATLLYRWKAYSASEDEPRKYVQGLIASDDGFATVAERLMSRGMSHGMNDRVGAPHNTFNQETIETFIGIAAAKERLDAIDTGALPEHREALETLTRFVDTWLGLRERPDHDF